MHAADVRYNLDCWLGVTKIQACWSGAIVTTISSIMYQSREHKWLDIAKINMNSGVSVSDMHACKLKFNRHDC